MRPTRRRLMASMTGAVAAVLVARPLFAFPDAGTVQAAADAVTECSGERKCSCWPGWREYPGAEWWPWNCPGDLDGDQIRRAEAAGDGDRFQGAD